MAAETSPSTGRRYGIAQVCRVWDVARRPSMLTGAGPTRRHRQFRRGAVDRNRRCLTTPCWRQYAPILPVRPGTVRDTARCGRGFA